MKHLKIKQIPLPSGADHPNPPKYYSLPEGTNLLARLCLNMNSRWALLRKKVLEKQRL